MTEVEICGGGHRTRLNNQLVCLWGAPSPVYKGGEEGAAGLMVRPQGGIPTPTRSRFPPFLVQLGEGGKGGKGRRKGEGGRAPNPLSNSERAWEGHAPPPGCYLSFPLKPIKAQHFFPVFP